MAVGKQEVARCLLDLELIMKLPLHLNSKLLSKFLYKLKICKKTKIAQLFKFYNLALERFAKFFLDFEMQV